MTAKAALALILLEGKVINIKNCFTLIGITNAPREISRSIEKDFGVEVSRTKRIGKNRFGKEIYWTDYRLNSSEHNIPGMKLMLDYCKTQYPAGQIQPSKTRKEEKAANSIKQTDLFVNSL